MPCLSTPADDHSPGAQELGTAFGPGRLQMALFDDSLVISGANFGQPLVCSNTINNMLDYGINSKTFNHVKNRVRQVGLTIL